MVKSGLLFYPQAGNMGITPFLKRRGHERRSVAVLTCRLTSFGRSIGLIQNNPVIGEHLGLGSKPAHLNPGSTHESDCLIADCFVIAVDNFAVSILVTDILSQFDILAFAVPAGTGNSAPVFQCVQSRAKVTAFTLVKGKNCFLI